MKQTHTRRYATRAEVTAEKERLQAAIREYRAEKDYESALLAQRRLQTLMHTEKRYPA